MRDFTNAVIVLTSNVGAQYLLNIPFEALSSEKSAAYRKVMEQVQHRFPPEFLNRLSAICMFNALGPKQLEQIIQKSMRGISDRIASSNHKIRVVLESSGVQAILAASYNPNYGARPVERYMESTVVTTLSRMLIQGELSSGSIVHIEAETSAAPALSNLDNDIVQNRSTADSDDSSYDDMNVPLQKKPRLHYRIELLSDMSGMDE
jgi:ATP-dependent Clp protease ATP-binding subunit ClpB